MRLYNSNDPALSGAVIAPLWRRALAWLIDTFLVFGIVILLALISLAIYSVIDYSHTGKWTLEYDAKDIEPSLAFGLTLLLLPYILYHTLLIHFWEGHTPGKNFMLVRVLSRRGGSVSWLQSIGRVLLQPISTVPLLLGYLAFFWSNKNSSLHDWAARTIVLQEVVEHKIIRDPAVAAKPATVHH